MSDNVNGREEREKEREESTVTRIIVELFEKIQKGKKPDWGFRINFERK